MTIYVEYVVIDNLTIDFVILLLCQKLTREKSKKINLFLSALFGTAVALLSPILSATINLILKPFVAVIMVIIAFKPKTIKKLGINILIFFAVTFLFGGASLGIMSLLGINFITQNGTIYEYNFPVGFAILVCEITYVATKNIIVYCTKQHKKQEDVYKISLINGSKKIEVFAFLDTGNCITDSGSPVTIINFDVFSKLFPNISITNLLLKKPLPLKDQKYLKIASLSNMKEEILTFKIDAIVCENFKTENAILALSLKNFGNKTSSDAIISKNILGE